MSLPEDEQPVTRRHFDESLKSIHESLKSINESFKSIDESFKSVHEDIARLAARLERAENTLLSGFHTYARREGARSHAVEIRLHDIEQHLIEIDERLGPK